MNSTQSNSTLSENIDLILDFISYYIISFICFVGILLNLSVSWIVISNLSKCIFYKHLIVKLLISASTCLVGIGYLTTVCEGCRITSSFTYVVYRWFILINMRVMFSMSSFHEIFLVLNRYMHMKNKNHWLANIKLKYYVPTLVVISFLLIAPFYFTFEIVRVDGEDLYYSKTTKFGQGTFIKLYTVFLILLRICVMLPTLMIITILCQTKYKKILRTKANVMKPSARKLLKLEQKYTRITIIMTVLTLIVKLLDTSSVVANNVIKYLDLELPALIVSLISLYRQSTFLIYFSFYALIELIFIQTDRNLKKSIKDIFTNMKVS